jgi:formylglycine-generating enzyme required for sulfatase activity
MLKDPVQKEKKESSFHVYRGGGWVGLAGNLVVSFRLRDSPGFRDYDLGFRPVRNAKEKK